jgi:hypothetical protein
MYIVREFPTDTFTELMRNEAIIVGEVTHPWQITELWSDDELAAINLYRVPQVALGTQDTITSYSFSRVDGVVTQIAVIATVPRVVSPRQIRLALSAIGQRAAVEAYVDAADITVQDSWHYTVEFYEDNPLILACMTALGKTEDDLKALFDIALGL